MTIAPAIGRMHGRNRDRRSMSYAFVSHLSACEALRARGLAGTPWPAENRYLPRRGDCIRLQRDFAQLAKEVDLEGLGIVSTPVDVLIPSSLMRSRGMWARTHGWVSSIPSHAMRRVDERVLVSSPEFVILQLAHAHIRRDPLLDEMIDRHVEERDELARFGIEAEAPYEDLIGWEHTRHLVGVIQVAMEFAGTYRLSTPNGATRYNEPQLMTIESALGFLDAVGTGNDTRRTQRALGLAADGSASPMETALFLLLTLPVDMGGFGLPVPVLNRAIPVRLGDEDLTPDLLWRSQRLVIEYQSDEFHAGKGRDKTDQDVMRANAMRAAGYQVLEVTPGILRQPSRVKALAEQVATLLGVTLDEADDDRRRVRTRLHHMLLGNPNDKG